LLLLRSRHNLHHHCAAMLSLEMIGKTVRLFLKHFILNAKIK